ncbi:protein of unknown function [Mesonia phycicola]|uniref:DUF4403 family protein n=1 Tax=Mesonia phycicola TaxID=579105 RepID=A0A1M6GJS3_9FLAO|nr:DUF4403 family protein [Mesonia phycicola]SHJ10182.1 protein of unknown function [Mesonia phycicola]
MKEVENRNYNEDGIIINIPVKIKLEALEKLIQDKLIGFKIKKDNSSEEKELGEITAISLSPGEEEYDVNIHQEVLLDTILFSNKKVKFSIQLKFEYDYLLQELVVSKYKVEGENKAWLTNQVLKVMMNTLLKKKILDKSKLLLLPKIEEAIQNINDKLENIIEVKEGVLVFGAIDQIQVINLFFKENDLVAILKIQGALAAEVSKIEIPE